MTQSNLPGNIRAPLPARARVSRRVQAMLTNAASGATLTVDGALAGGVRLAVTNLAYHTELFRYEGVGQLGGDSRGAVALVGSAGQFTWRLAFDFDGQKFRVGVLGDGGSLRVWSNEQPSAWILYPNDFAYHTVLVDFASRAYRRIVVEFDSFSSPGGYGAYFGGIDRLPADTLFPASLPPCFKLAVVGDSYTVGSACTYASTGYVQTLGRMLGTQNVLNLGQGGSGWTNPGGAGQKYTDPARIADLTANQPDVILAQGSINDFAHGGDGTIGTAIASWIPTVKAACPNSQIILSGVMRPANATAADLLCNADIKAAATAAGVPFIDPQTGPTGAWYTGTGTVGAPTGDGNADWYMSSTVANHPSQAGHDATAARFAREISAPLGLAI